MYTVCSIELVDRPDPQTQQENANGRWCGSSKQAATRLFFPELVAGVVASASSSAVARPSNRSPTRDKLLLVRGGSGTCVPVNCRAPPSRTCLQLLRLLRVPFCVPVGKRRVSVGVGGVIYLLSCSKGSVVNTSTCLCVLRDWIVRLVRRKFGRHLSSSLRVGEGRVLRNLLFL